jgi:hypothetical protein
MSRGTTQRLVEDARHFAYQLIRRERTTYSTPRVEKRAPLEDGADQNQC